MFSSKNHKLYVGSTDNLKRRIEEHNSGAGGVYTKNARPPHLIFYEAFLSKKNAHNQESLYKSGYGREVLKGKIVNSLISIHSGVV